MHTTLRNHHLTARRSLAALSTAAALTLGLVTGPTPAAQAVPVDGSVTTTDTNTAPDTSGVTPLYRAPWHRLVTTRDKLKVSVYEYGPSARTAETIVMTGGWPWNSSGMEPFAQVLATKFHVVRYDQRGSGQSSHPEDSNLYTMERLADEMLDVIHATTLPRQKVHVFGEAWCPFIAAQLTWQMGKKSPIATLTSLGAPSIDLAANLYHHTMQSGTPAKKVQARKQHAALSYIWFLHAHPDLFEEYVVKTHYMTNLSNAAMKYVGGDFNATLLNEDVHSGVNKYRIGFMTHWDHPEYDYIDIPVVHVLHMTNDFIETEYLLDGLEERTPHYMRHDINGDHMTWVTSMTTIIDYIYQTVQTYHQLYR